MPCLTLLITKQYFVDVCFKIFLSIFEAFLKSLETKGNFATAVMLSKKNRFFSCFVHRPFEFGGVRLQSSTEAHAVAVFGPKHQEILQEVPRHVQRKKQKKERKRVESGKVLESCLRYEMFIK